MMNVAKSETFKNFTILDKALLFLIKLNKPAVQSVRITRVFWTALFYRLTQPSEYGHTKYVNLIDFFVVKLQNYEKFFFLIVALKQTNFYSKWKLIRGYVINVN